MKKLILNVLSVQMFAQPNSRGNVCAIITKPSSSNPSANGVHEVNQAQLQRIVTRCLGVYNPIGFKHMIEVCNGAAKMTIDALDCKVGEAYKKSNGESDTYTKDWTKYSNHEVSLGIIGSMKLAELSLSVSFNHAAEQYLQTPVTRKVAEVVVTETANENTGTETDAKSDEIPTV